MADNSDPMRFFWPEIDDLPSAIAASRLGAFGCAAYGALSIALITYTVVSSSGTLNSTAWGAYIESAVFLALAGGIWLYWRSAAMVALALFIVEQVLGALHAGRVVGVLIPLLVFFLLTSGVRGTVGYRKFVHEAASSSNGDA